MARVEPVYRRTEEGVELILAPEYTLVSPEAARDLYTDEIPAEWLVEACGHGNLNPEDTRLLLVTWPDGSSYVAQIEYVLERHGMHLAWSRRPQYVMERARMETLRELREMGART